MALLHLNARNGQISTPGDSPAGLVARLRQEIRHLPPATPILILVHGYRYSPFEPDADPHTRLFAAHHPGDSHRVRSWPRQLAGTPLLLAYGWDAAPEFASPVRNLPDVYLRAAREARTLARLVALLAEIAPGRPVDFLAHSMGAKVVLGATALAPHQSIGRVILMGAASFARDALRALRSPAGRTAAFYNITSHQNRLYDWLFARLGPSSRVRGCVLGQGLTPVPRNWVDICADDHGTLRRLSRHGILMDPPEFRFCHWAFFTRPGIFNLYRHILNRAPNSSPVAFQTAEQVAIGDRFYGRAVVSTLLWATIGRRKITLRARRPDPAHTAGTTAPG